MTTEAANNKQRIQAFIQTVWVGQDLAALPRFWTEDCVNHAMAGPDNRGLAALQRYHQAFMADFAAFADLTLDIVQQVAERDLVVTHLVTHGTQVGPFFGLAPSGKHAALATIRIDRLRDGRIAEHWSVADVAGLMQQLQS